MYYCSNSGNSVTLTASITPRLFKIKGKKITKFNKILLGEVVVFVLKKHPPSLNAGWIRHWKIFTFFQLCNFFQLFNIFSNTGFQPEPSSDYQFLQYFQNLSVIFTNCDQIQSRSGLQKYL